MKYGKIYDFENFKEAEKLIGKNVLFTDSYMAIKNGDSKKAYTGHLMEVCNNTFRPFRTALGLYQFVREIIEEPTYRPFTVEELKKQVGKVVINNKTGDWVTVTVFDNYYNKIGLARLTYLLNAEDFLKNWKFADDGTPCGVKED